VKGGRVVGDWPGLGPSQLYQQRDLRASTGLDAVIAGIAAESMGLDPHHVATELFKGSATPVPVTDLVRV